MYAITTKVGNIQKLDKYIKSITVFINHKSSVKMKTTEEKVSVFLNPFKNLPKEKINCWISGQEISCFIPEHEFLVISETKTSEKFIVWIPQDASTSLHRTVFEEKETWEQFCLWTEGTASLEVDDIIITLSITKHHSCNVPNMSIIQPFFKETFERLHEVFNKLDMAYQELHGEELHFILEVDFKELRLGSLSRIRKPVHIYERSNWIK